MCSTISPGCRQKFAQCLMLVMLAFPGVSSWAADESETAVQGRVTTGTVVEQAAEQAAQKAVEKATESVVEKAAEKAAQKVVDKAQEKTTDKVVEKAAAIAAEKAVAVAAEQEAMKAKRPDAWRGPTKVQFAIFLLDVDAIDDANQAFMANVYLKLRWKDRRLADPEKHTRRLRLEDVWNPQVILANRQGLVSHSLPEVVQVDPDGTVTYRQRYSGMLSQSMQLSNFPMDRHVFNVQFVSAAYRADELEFTPGPSAIDPTKVGGLMAEALSLPDWQVLHYEALSMPYQPVPAVNSAGFVFRFEAERYVEYYYWQVVLPLTLVVFMAWSAFWVQRGERAVRIGVATSSVLTLIAQRFVLASLIPRLPYMTRMDYFTVGCTLLVFIALLGVVSTAFLGTVNREIGARRIDLWLRGLFPVSYLALLGRFVYG